MFCLRNQDITDAKAFFYLFFMSNSGYLLNFLLLKKEEILTTYLQGGQGNLSASILKEIYIPTPCLAEQTKIANFLSAIDQKIEVVAQQIEQAKTWKKGLLQQMFI